MEFKPRFYQQPAIDELWKGWDFSNPAKSEFRRQLLQAPTGTGKAPMIIWTHKHVIETQDMPVLTLVHREELINQAALSGHEFCGFDFDIIKGGIKRTNFNSMNKIASVQTLYKRLQKSNGSLKEIFGNKIPGFITFDESHHIKSNTWKAILEAFPHANVQLATATPIRLSGAGFEDVADRMVCAPSVKELENIWSKDSEKKIGLVPDYIIPVKLSRELDNVQVKRGEYDNEPLNRILNTDEICDKIVDCWLEYTPGEKTIAFCQKGKIDGEGMHQRLVRAFRRRGISADYIDGSTKAVNGEDAKTRRRRVLKDFAEGRITILTNMEILTEGFDEGKTRFPITATLLCRKTKSLGLYLQMVGRGKRPGGIEKTRHTLYDFVGMREEHGRPNYPHEWTLKGITKKRKRNILIENEDGIFMEDQFSELPDPPTVHKMRYDVIEYEDDEFRVPSFIKTLEHYRAYVKPDYKAVRRALSDWYSKIDHKPELIEMQVIARILFPDWQRDACDVWAQQRFSKFRNLSDGIENCTNIHQANQLMILLESILISKNATGVQVMLPGYMEIKSKIKQLSNSFLRVR